KEKWQNLFRFNHEQRVETWAQIVAHGVPLAPEFLGERAGTALKEEIETFNSSISIVGYPRWLTRETREGQQTGSIVFAVKDEETCSVILHHNRIIIAGKIVKIVKYRTISPSHQCGKCQRFGHPMDSCYKLACRLCGEAHKTQEHNCLECSSKGRPYKHTIPKCVNCKGGHFANSK
ncbi:uncharacterized protein EI97DRAFT_343570, partial [Westerdykella ornata]